MLVAAIVRNYRLSTHLYVSLKNPGSQTTHTPFSRVLPGGQVQPGSWVMGSMIDTKDSEQEQLSLAASEEW